MRSENVYYVDKNNHVQRVSMPYQWNGGFSSQGKRTAVANLHQAFKNYLPSYNPLEISSVSNSSLGNKLSAMHLTIPIKNYGTHTVEQVFQSGKVFRAPNGQVHQMSSSLNKRSVDAKHASKRANRNEQLVGFNLFGMKFPLKPRTAFYDYIYLNALMRNVPLRNQILSHDSFTDFWSQFGHTINTQSKSCALFVALDRQYGLNGLKQILNDKDKFIAVESGKHVDLSNSRDNSASVNVNRANSANVNRSANTGADNGIHYTDDNLFTSPAQVLVNPVNTVGAMGKGLALDFKKLYPDMYQQYRNLCRTGQLKVGNPWLYKGRNKWILNFPTKRDWRDKSQLSYIQAGLQDFAQNYRRLGIKSIAFPRIGAGLGGLDWQNQVQPMMERYLSKLPIDVYVHSYNKNKYMSIPQIRDYLQKEGSSQSQPNANRPARTAGNQSAPQQNTPTVNVSYAKLRQATRAVLALQHEYSVHTEDISKALQNMPLSQVNDSYNFVRSLNIPNLQRDIRGGYFNQNDWNKDLRSADGDLAKIDNYNRSHRHPIHAISCVSPNYPQNLRTVRTHRFPPILYVKGDLSALNTKSIAIVGSRNETSKGKQLTRQYAQYFANKGYTDIGGLALGTDSVGHRAALQAGGRTIAVMPESLDQSIYPWRHRYLADDIINNGGALVSEYPMGTPVGGTQNSKRDFAIHLTQRDEWQSGMADGVLAVEASPGGGGTRHAMNHSREQGRPLAAPNGAQFAQQGMPLNSQGTQTRINNGSAIPLGVNGENLDAFEQNMSQHHQERFANWRKPNVVNDRQRATAQQPNTVNTNARTQSRSRSQTGRGSTMNRNQIINSQNLGRNYFIIQSILKRAMPGVTNSQIRDAMRKAHVPTGPNGFLLNKQMVYNVGVNVQNAGQSFNLSQSIDQQLQNPQFIVSRDNYLKSISKNQHLQLLTSADPRGTIADYINVLQPKYGMILAPSNLSPKYFSFTHTPVIANDPTTMSDNTRKQALNNGQLLLSPYLMSEQAEANNTAPNGANNPNVVQTIDASRTAASNRSVNNYNQLLQQYNYQPTATVESALMNANNQRQNNVRSHPAPSASSVQNGVNNNPQPNARPQNNQPNTTNRPQPTGQPQSRQPITNNQQSNPQSQGQPNQSQTAPNTVNGTTKSTPDITPVRTFGTDAKHINFFNQDIAKHLAPYTDASTLQAIKNKAPRNLYYSSATANRGFEVLNYLQDKGIDFQLQLSGPHNNKYRLEAHLPNAGNKDVDILDLDDDPRFCGTIGLPYGKLYYAPHMASKQRVFNQQTGQYQYQRPTFSRDFRPLIDYIVGDRSAQVLHNTKGTSTLLLDGSKDLHLPPIIFMPSSNGRNIRTELKRSIENDYATDSGNPADAARSYLNHEISVANDQYSQLVLGDDMRGTNDLIADDQSKLNSFVQNNADINADTVTRVFNYMTDNGGGIDTSSDSPDMKVLNEVHSIAQDRIGTYDDGIDPDLVIKMNKYQTSGNPSNKIMTALMMADYTDDHEFKTNGGNTVGIEDHMIAFNPNDKNMLTPNSSITTVGSDNKPVVDPVKKLKVHILKHVQNKLLRGRVFGDNGNQAPQVEMDSQGIIHWKGVRHYGYMGQYKRSHNVSDLGVEHVQGQIGQVFAPDNHHIIHTKFGSKDDFNLIPSIQGYLVRGKGSMASRMRGKGYNQVLSRRVDQALDAQMVRSVPTRQRANAAKTSYDLTSAHDPAILNAMYHSELDGTRLPNNWYENSLYSDDFKNVILDTLAGKVRFPNELGEMASTLGYLRSKKSEQNGYGPSEAMKMTNGKNIRTLNWGKGILDQNMTGTGATQGIARFMAKGAKLNPDHTFSKSNITDHVPGSPLMEHPLFKRAYYNAWDRNMSVANLAMAGLRIAPRTRGSLMTLGGHTFDDAIVVSKHFADTNKVHPMVRGHYDDKGHVVKDPHSDNKVIDNDHLRPLTNGDKLSDFGFNKFTIGCIVNTDDGADAAQEAKNAGLSKEREIMRDGNLDVVMSPYSHITRDNTAVAHQLVDNPDKKTFQYKDGAGVTKTGTSSTLPLIVTNKMADRQNNVYNDKERREGKGNKMSNQLDWVLTAQKAGTVAHAAYNSNRRNWSKLREYLLATGVDMGPDGYLYPGDGINDYQRGKDGKIHTFDPHPNDKRKLFTTMPSRNPDADYPSVTLKDGSVVPSSRKFIHDLGTQGGELQLPFNIKMQSGLTTNNLPIVSASLRRNSQMGDKVVQINDYNQKYQNIFKAALSYNRFAQKIANTTDDKKIKSYKTKMSNQQARAQGLYNNFSTEIINDKLGGFNGEHNKNCFMRNHILSTRVEHSAYNVATADSRVPLNQIWVGPKTYHALSMDKPGHKNDYILAHRDPCLHYGSDRAFKVVMKKHLHGEAFAMNPVDDKIFDGDFDGDHYGLQYISHDPKVQQAMTKIDVPHNLLQISGTDSKGKPSISTTLNSSMDFVSGAVNAGYVKQSPYVDTVPVTNDKGTQQYGFDGKPLMKTQIDKKRDDAIFGKDARNIEANCPKDANGTPISSADQLNDKLVNNALGVKDWHKLSAKDRVNAVKNANKNPNTLKITQRIVDDSMVNNNYGSVDMNITSEQDMLNSLGKIVASGAKASPKKLGVFKNYYENFKNLPNPSKAHEKAAVDIQRANGMKTDLTGVAGSKSQSLMVAEQDLDPNNVLDNTYWATQTVLQIKHDPSAGGPVINALQNTDKKLLSGCDAHMPKKYLYERGKKGDRDRAGYHITPNQFVDEYSNMRKDCSVSVDRRAARRLADLLTLQVDPKTGKVETETNAKGQVVPKHQKYVRSVDKQAELFGSPLNQISYAKGGFNKINNLALSSIGKVKGYDPNKKKVTIHLTGKPARKRSLAEGKENGTASVVPDPMKENYQLSKENKPEKAPDITKDNSTEAEVVTGYHAKSQSLDSGQVQRIAQEYNKTHHLDIDRSGEKSAEDANTAQQQTPNPSSENGASRSQTAQPQNSGSDVSHNDASSNNEFMRKLQEGRQEDSQPENSTPSTDGADKGDDGDDFEA